MADIESSLTASELRQRYSSNSSENKPLLTSEKGNRNKSSDTIDILVIASIATLAVLTTTGILVLLVHFFHESLDNWERKRENLL